MVLLSFFLFSSMDSRWLIYRDDPRYHGAVTEKELNRIHKNKSEEHKDAKRRDVPYWVRFASLETNRNSTMRTVQEIIKNKTVIVCWVSAFLDITSTILLVTYAPIYFHKVRSTRCNISTNMKDELRFLNSTCLQQGFLFPLSHFHSFHSKLYSASQVIE